MTRAEINGLKQEMLDVRCGFEWAYSQGPTRVRELALRDPDLAAAVRRVAEIHALLAEHSV